MIHFTRLSLLLGMAASLAAQTLSFGEISLVTPATTPPTYTVNLVLKTAGTANAGLVAGLQRGGDRLTSAALGVQGLLAAAFLLFILFTSNPFLRIDPAPFEKLLDVREARIKPKEMDPLAVLAAYLRAIDTVIDAVDRLQK